MLMKKVKKILCMLVAISMVFSNLNIVYANEIVENVSNSNNIVIAKQEVQQLLQ